MLKSLYSMKPRRKLEKYNFGNVGQKTSNMDLNNIMEPPSDALMNIDDEYDQAASGISMKPKRGSVSGWAE